VTRRRSTRLSAPSGVAVLGLLAVVAVVAACSATPAGDTPGTSSSAGTAGPSTGVQPSRSAEVAEPIDVGGGRTIYLECHGTGSPTVILLSGFGNAADIWQEADAYPPSVAAGAASFTRVCSYDRPGSYVVTVEQHGSRVQATSPDQYKPARGGTLSPRPRRVAARTSSRDCASCSRSQELRLRMSWSGTPSEGCSPSSMRARTRTR
jgi:hypothetical protein